MQQFYKNGKILDECELHYTNGIYNTLILATRSENKNQLDLDQRQTAQDNLTQIKK